MRGPRAARWALVAWLAVSVTTTTATVSGSATARREHRLVLVAPSLTDGRVGHLRDAIAFWNRTLQELALDIQIVEIRTLVAPDETDAFENYTRQIWQQAGRIRGGMGGPAEPDEVSDLGGDVVVFLSVQPTMSFAWPLDADRHFVAVPAEPGSRFQRAGSTPNVLAHELGHTLGLIHHRDPLVLMCSPCRPSLGAKDPDGYLPLTEADRDRLRARYIH